MVPCLPAQAAPQLTFVGVDTYTSSRRDSRHCPDEVIRQARDDDMDIEAVVRNCLTGVARILHQQTWASTISKAGF